jgi:RHS repeat-associated protein
MAVLNGSTLYYLHDDRLGTPQLATDSEQNTQWQANYDPFGTTTSVSGEVVQNLRLPGQYFDLESGFYHNGFRDYLPALGRYAEPDPLGRQAAGITCTCTSAIIRLTSLIFWGFAGSIIRQPE